MLVKKYGDVAQLMIFLWRFSNVRWPLGTAWSL